MAKDQKRAQKKKKRQESNKNALVAERAERLKRKKLSEYPEFVIGRKDADPEFINAVLDAVKRFDFLDSAKLGSVQQAFLKQCKAYGLRRALEMMKSVPSINLGDQRVIGDAKLVIAITGVGSHLLSLVPLETRQKYMPYNHVSVDITGREIRLNFSSMDSVGGEGGRVYFNRIRPKIEFDGTNYTVAFSRHAVERICERIKPDFTDYRAAGDVHAFFSTCVYFEPVFLYGDQPAFALYDMCGNKGFTQYSMYAIGVFGESNIKPGDGSLYYRLGYCPIVFENGFAKAKTIVSPGFRSTPEYGLVLRSRLGYQEKQDLLKRISDDNGNQAERLKNHDNTAAKWFHENGLPQVFQWKRDVFVHPKR